MSLTLTLLARLVVIKIIKAKIKAAEDDIKNEKPVMSDSDILELKGIFEGQGAKQTHQYRRQVGGWCSSHNQEDKED